MLQRVCEYRVVSQQDTSPELQKASLDLQIRLKPSNEQPYANITFLSGVPYYSSFLTDMPGISSLTNNACLDRSWFP